MQPTTVSRATLSRSTWLGRMLESLRAARGGAQPSWSDEWYVSAPVNTSWPQAAGRGALGIPPFGRGVELIAAGIAGMPLHVHRRGPDGRLMRLPQDPQVVRDPWPVATPWQWRYSVVEDLILYGNAFGLLGDPDASGWPTSLLPVPADRVELVTDRETGRVAWRVAGRMVPWGDLWHCSAGARGGKLLGRGVLAQYRDVLAGSTALAAHARAYFRSGGLPSAVIQPDDPDLTQEQAQALKSQYAATIGAGSREPLVLPATTTFTPVVTDADKQQLVESRTWDAQTVAMLLGIPPHKLGLPVTTMTYQNVEQAEIAWQQDTLRRYADPIEHAVTKWLLPRGQEAQFDWSERLRTDVRTRSDVDVAEVAAGIRTVDEVRLSRDLPALPAANVTEEEAS